MNPFWLKLDEVAGSIRQDPVLAAAAGPRFAALEAWMAELRAADPEAAEERCKKEVSQCLGDWKGVLLQLGTVLSAEKMRWEEEKRKWGSFGNPYTKKIGEYVEQTNRHVSAQPIQRTLAVSRLYQRNLTQDCLLETHSATKCFYTLPIGYLEKLVLLINREYALYFSGWKEKVRGDLAVLRRREFAALGRIPDASFERVEFKLDYKGAYEIELDEEKYTESVRLAEPFQKVVLANLVKTLRAPTVLLMTGAFIYATAFGGTLKDLLSGVFRDYPISFWLFLIGLLIYFVQTTREEWQTKYRAARLEERERSWNTIKSALKSDLNGLIANLKTDMKDFIAKIADAEKEWADAIREVYLAPYFDEKINPLLQHQKALATADLELTRLAADLQRAAFMPTRSPQKSTV